MIIDWIIVAKNNSGCKNENLHLSYTLPIPLPSFEESLMNRTLTALLLAAFSLGAQAQSAGEIQPGMWEYQMESQMTGMPMKMPPTTIKRCLTAQDVAQNKHLAGDQKNPCTVSNMKASGGKVSYEFSCKMEQGSMKGSSSGSASATAMDIQTNMQMNMQGQPPMQMQQKMKARRLGNC